MRNSISREDFYNYFNAGINVIPMEMDTPLIAFWDTLDWEDLKEDVVNVVNQWFTIYEDKITGVGVPLGETHNPGLCCLKINTRDLEIRERVLTEFNSPYSVSAKNIQYVFFKNTHEGVLNKYDFKCPGNNGYVKAMYRGDIAILPPSFHSEFTLFQYSDPDIANLLSTPINELPELCFPQMKNIGKLINSPSVDTANMELSNEEQFKGRSEREFAIKSLLNKIYDNNPSNDLNDTVSQVLDYDALNYPMHSFFLGGNNKSSSRDANALAYVSNFNMDYFNETGITTEFDKKVETEEVSFNKFIPITEAHEKFIKNDLPIFDINLVPDIWRSMVEDIYEGQGTPPQGLFMAMFTALGACMQGNTIIRPKKHIPFFKRTNIALAMVASSGSKKSDVIRIAIKEVNKIDKNLAESNSKEDITRIMDLEKKIERLNKEKNKNDADFDKINEEIHKLQDELDANPLKGTKFIYGNAPVQKMILDASKNQKTGLFMIKDEMKQIYADMKKKGNEDYRSFYMEGFDGNGDRFKYSTISRGDNFIDKHVLSMLTAVQPDVLSVHIKNLYSAYGDNDGFLQRIILIPFGNPPVKRPKDIDFRKFTKSYEVFNRAFYHEDIEVKISDEAIEYYDDLIYEIRLKAERYSANEPLKSILSKHEGLLCSFAYIYEVLNSESIPVEITRESLEIAKRLLDYIGDCAKYLFDVKDKVEDYESAVNLAKMISARHFRNGATRSEWHQGCRTIFKYPVSFYNALDELELRGYVATKRLRNNSEKVWINPLVNNV